MIGSPLHLAAREWALRGVPVFPCVAGTKRPLYGSSGYKDATTDLDQIDKWWSTGDHNVAIYPGGCGEAVLDVDPDKGGLLSLAALELCHGPLPKTFTVQTPSTGYHYYYIGTLPKNTVSKLGPGLDTRSIGGYVLVPPSQTDRGHYRVVSDGPRAELPEWISALVVASNRATIGEDVEPDLDINIRGYREWIRRQPGVPDGQRNDAASTIIGYAADFGVSKATALPLVYEWGARCTPPIPCPDDKIENHGLWLRRQNSGAPLAQDQDIDVTFAAALADMPVTRSRFHPYTLEELLQRPPPEWLVVDVIPERGVGYFYGESGAYKSYLMLSLCMQIAKTRPVLYVIGEGDDIIARRWEAIQSLVGENQLRVVTAMPQTNNPTEMAEMVDVVTGEGITGVALVVLDTLSTAMGALEETKDTDMRLFVASMKALRDTLGCAVCAVHHVGQVIKSRARGSYVLVGDVDFIGQVDTPEEDSGYTMLTMRKQRVAPKRKAPFYYEGMQVAGELAFQEISAAEWHAVWSANDLMAPGKVSTALASYVGEDAGITTSALATMLCPPLADEDVKVTDNRRQAMAKELKRRASRDLFGYCSGEGAKLRWFVTVNDQ
jgi:Bifunctional DNA primase/polymerase, N-terminal/AAA domain